MAAKNPPSFASAAADELTCPICFQFYITPHEPKNLPQCYHMCCCHCLKKMTKGGLKSITCPQCNKASNLPDNGVEGLMTCLAIRNLAGKHPDGIKQHKGKMQAEIEQLQKQNDRLLENEEDIREQIKASTDKEVREVEKMIESVITQEQDMIRQIRDFGRSNQSQTEENIAQIKQHKTDIEQLRNKLTQMTNQEFQTQVDAMVDQISKLKVNQASACGMGDYFPAKFVAENVKLGRVAKPRRLELLAGARIW